VNQNTLSHTHTGRSRSRVSM